jgi:RES domain
LIYLNAGRRAGANFINAAFVYFRPRELNRFNGPGRGAWYAALAVETCQAEVAFHLARELNARKRPQRRRGPY